MQTVVMPKMGDTMEEGKILTWRKQEGDTVARATRWRRSRPRRSTSRPRRSPRASLRKIIVPEGETVPVGAAHRADRRADEPIPAEFGGAPAQAAQPTPSLPGRLPRSRRSGERHAARREGAAARAARAASAAASVAVANGHVAQPTAPSAAPSVTQNGQDGGRIFISPIARHIAAEHNLDIAQLQGTGPGGRIIREDVLEALPARPGSCRIRRASRPRAAPCPPTGAERSRRCRSARCARRLRGACSRACRPRRTSTSPSRWTRRG